MIVSTKFGNDVEEAANGYWHAEFTVYDISTAIDDYSFNGCMKIRYHLKRLGYKCKQTGDYYSYSLEH